MTRIVVIADPIAEAGVALLRAEAGLQVEWVAGDPSGLDDALPRAHGLIVRSETQVTAARIAAAGELRVIGRAGVGVDNIDVQAATQRGIPVLKVSGGNTVSAAEHTVALLLALLRRIPDAAVSMQEGAWARSRFTGSEAWGKCLGLVGLGQVGQHVAAVAQGLGMSVVACDPFVPAARAQALGVRLLALDAVLTEADVVSLHLPLTGDTRRLMDADRLALLRPTAVLINTARGGLVDHEALLQAVQSGRLAGAALDVFDEEPLPADSPLRRAERILVTPHIAASTVEAQARVSVSVCEGVRNALLLGTYRGVVNPEVV